MSVKTSVRFLEPESFSSQLLLFSSKSFVGVVMYLIPIVHSSAFFSRVSYKNADLKNVNFIVSNLGTMVSFPNKFGRITE